MPQEVDAPLVRVGFGEPKTVIGNAIFGRPSPWLHLDARVPNRIPGIVAPVIIIEPDILQRPGSGQREFIPRLMIMIGVDEDVDPIRFTDAVASDQLPVDLVGFRIVAPEGDVQRLVIVHDRDLGRFGGHGPVIGVPLTEISRYLEGMGCPAFVGEIAVNVRCMGVDPSCLNLWYVTFNLLIILRFCGQAQGCTQGKEGCNSPCTTPHVVLLSIGWIHRDAGRAPPSHRLTTIRADSGYRKKR